MIRFSNSATRPTNKHFIFLALIGDGCDGE